MAEEIKRDEAAAARWEASLAKDRKLAEYLKAREQDDKQKEKN